MKAFEPADLNTRRERSGEMYLEFLREPTMSAGLYALPADGTDAQTPHHEDELYVVIEGQGSIRVADESRPVGPGSVIFVGAEVSHRFEAITEDLRVLVVFSPPESEISSG
jgi:mannose-6-phosphate isomerase-like protein (cupin superfamily)